MEHGTLQMVNVLWADADLGEGLDTQTRQRVERHSYVRSAFVEKGPWTPAETAPGGVGMLGLLMLDGLATRRVSLDGSSSLELLGPGDLVRPEPSEADSYAMIPSLVEWRVHERLRVAVLDDRFEHDLCQVAPVMHQLRRRLDQRLATQGERLAIARQPKLSARLHFFFWHLADRFGRRTREGVRLPLPLTHDLLAELVLAQRPSVSRALGEIPAALRPVRRADGSWWLPGQPPSAGALSGSGVDV